MSLQLVEGSSAALIRFSMNLSRNIWSPSLEVQVCLDNQYPISICPLLLKEPCKYPAHNYKALSTCHWSLRRDVSTDHCPPGLEPTWLFAYQYKADMAGGLLNALHQPESDPCSHNKTMKQVLFILPMV